MHSYYSELLPNHFDDFFNITKHEYMLVRILIQQDILKEQDCLPHRHGMEV